MPVYKLVGWLVEKGLTKVVEVLRRSVTKLLTCLVTVNREQCAVQYTHCHRAWRMLEQAGPRPLQSITVKLPDIYLLPD